MFLAGSLGFEPRITVLETVVLPVTLTAHIVWYSVGVMLSSHLGEGQIATLAASRNKFGAGTENRTRILTLARSQATIASHPQILVVLEGNTPSS